MKFSKLTNKIYDKIITMIGDFKVYKYPFFMVYDPSEYCVTGDEMHEVIDCIRAGDILLRGYTFYLDGKLIPGTFSHVAFYSGNDKVIHAMAEGVKEESLLSFLRCDMVAVLRFKKISKRDVDKAVKAARSLIGKEYDFEFESDDDKYYCAELLPVIYKHRPDLEISPKELKMFFGLVKKLIIVPDAFLDSQALEEIYINEMAKQMLIKAKNRN